MTTRSLSKKLALCLPAFLAAVFALGCTDTEIVYRDPAPYNPPADASSGFLGYYTSASQQTTCGNCHADIQGAWSETAHAEAYETLHSNAGAQDFCYACHTVNGNGNAGTNPIGYMKVKDSTYFDVQCESCHGQGQEHVDKVNQGQVVKPLARVSVGYRTKYESGVYTHEVTADTAASCASCHTGVHHPYVEQWAESRHAYSRVGYANRIGCGTQCHEGRGALESWGVEPVWKEGSLNPGGLTSGTVPFDQNITPLTCAVCHDPHGGPNSHQLRFPINSTDESQNLCMKCHNRRATPEPPTGSSPHGPQGAVLLGFAGYRPPNFVYDTARIYGSHASPTANTELCAGCHVQRQTITAGGAFQLESVGHLFKPVPCLDSKGNPSAEPDCEFNATARSWNACTKSGCHANATVAANAFNATRAEMATLAGILWTNSGGSGTTLDPYPTDTGYLPKLKAKYPGLWTGPELSEAEGCEYNVRLLAEALTSHPDASKGTHNPFLYRALFSSCISYLAGKYPGDLPAPPAEVQALIDRWNAPVMGNAPLIARVPLPSYNR
jgi:predicted CXXCH cytochrome family protein